MEERKKCNIVQDLMLNYIDGVLTEDSKDFVEEHLSICKNCQEKLDDMKKDIEDSKNEDEEKEIDYLKNVKKKISKKNTFIIIIGVILAITITLNVAVFINYSLVACNMQIFLNDDITAEELENIKQKIKFYDSEAEIIYNSNEDALEDMKKSFGEDTNLLSPYEGKNNIFPASYIVKSKLEYLRDIEDSIISMSGVRKISSNINTNPYELFLMNFISFFKN